MLQYLCATGTERILDNYTVKAAMEKTCIQITFPAERLHLLLQDSCGVDSRLGSGGGGGSGYWHCVSTS